MVRPWRVAVLSAVLVAIAMGCTHREGVTTADRRAFCELARQPNEFSAALTDEDARRRLDADLAAAEAVAPRDIRDTVSVYRRETQIYVRTLATGPADAEAERSQFKAGMALVAYVKDHCL